MRVCFRGHAYIHTVTGWLAVPPEPVVGLGDVLEKAAVALERGDLAGARAELFLVDLPSCDSYWRACEAANAAARDPLAHRNRQAPKIKGAVGAATKRRIGERDGWRCRYCGLRVVANEFLRRLQAAMPEAFPEGPGHTRSGFNPIWRAVAHVGDHVIPLAAGGENTIDNLVSACWPCNFAAKADCTIEELHAPPLRPADAVSTSGWDGLRGRGAVRAAS